MSCVDGGLRLQLAAAAAVTGFALALVTVSCVGVTPVTAEDDVIVICTWIEAGLLSEPVTSTGAESAVLLVALALPGVHTSAPPAVMLSSVLALVDHVPADTL